MEGTALNGHVNSNVTKTLSAKCTLCIGHALCILTILVQFSLHHVCGTLQCLMFLIFIISSRNRICQDFREESNKKQQQNFHQVLFSFHNNFCWSTYVAENWKREKSYWKSEGYCYKPLFILLSPSGSFTQCLLNQYSDSVLLKF